MALTKEFEYDCEVRGEHKAVQVRKVTIIKDGGEEISRTYNRHVLHCRTKTGDTWGDTDISGDKDEVDDEGNPVYQGIDQSKLVPLLTAALQEAIAKIETLETKVAALEAE